MKSLRLILGSIAAAVIAADEQALHLDGMNKADNQGFGRFRWFVSPRRKATGRGGTLVAHVRWSDGSLGSAGFGSPT